jgi:NAD(P)-dependent dehydrogenase (short-subunit alcohol dehydrogenase family)
MTKTALVTGASSGIGEATARRLQDLGYTVYGAARRVERMKALAGEGIRVLAVDVTDDASMVAAVDKVIAETGRIDLLVNNAGYGSYGAVEDVPLDEARHQFEVNLFGLARLTQLVTPHMRARRIGRIVNVSSIGGKFSEPLGGWYHATKFAVEGLSDALRMELEPFGIDVIVIEPGAIRTEWGSIAHETLMKASGHTAYADQAERLVKVHRSGAERAMAAPEVIADAIAAGATARRPRTRYVAPRNARVMLGVLRFLPDRTVDTIFRWAMRPGRRLSRQA